MFYRIKVLLSLNGPCRVPDPNKENNTSPHLSWFDQSVPAWGPSALVSEGCPRRRRRSPGGVPGRTGLPDPAAEAARWPG